MKYLDMHCDTLSIAMTEQEETMTHLAHAMVDMERLEKSGAAAQFFAMFLPQRNVPEWFGLPEMPPLEELLGKMNRIFQTTLKENENRLAFAQSYEQLQQNLQKGKLSAFLTIENAAVVNGKLENLKKFHAMGVGLMTLTWNDANCFGQNHSKNPALMQTGLTDFGKEAISYMNELGIVIDVSHLSDGGFYDVAALSSKPFVASHSNCRALSPATRNLTDEMIRILAEKGGVAGVNFEPSFLNQEQTDPKSRVNRICDHIEHFIKVGGVECVGIGSDFDGISGQFEIADCTKMELLFTELHRRGISFTVIEKIAFSNAARVVRESMREAEESGRKFQNK